jgi:hypothetical protein
MRRKADGYWLLADGLFTFNLLTNITSKQHFFETLRTRRAAKKRKGEAYGTSLRS